MKGDRFILYKYSSDTDNSPDYDGDIKEFHSTLSKPLLKCVCDGEKTKEYNDLYTEIRWMVASHLNLRIFYIEQDHQIVHTSFCTPKSFKFPFMKKKDYHIGPCFTNESFRGQGIYPMVLHHIGTELKQNPKCGDIYMIIEENNAASRNGVVKAGFVETAELYRKGRLKKYYVRKWY